MFKKKKKKKSAATAIKKKKKGTLSDIFINVLTFCWVFKSERLQVSIPPECKCPTVTVWFLIIQTLKGIWVNPDVWQLRHIATNFSFLDYNL